MASLVRPDEHDDGWGPSVSGERDRDTHREREKGGRVGLSGLCYGVRSGLEMMVRFRVLFSMSKTNLEILDKSF